MFKLFGAKWLILAFVLGSNFTLDARHTHHSNRLTPHPGDWARPPGPWVEDCYTYNKTTKSWKTCHELPHACMSGSRVRCLTIGGAYDRLMHWVDTTCDPDIDTRETLAGFNCVTVPYGGGNNFKCINHDGALQCSEDAVSNMHNRRLHHYFEADHR